MALYRISMIEPGFIFEYDTSLTITLNDRNRTFSRFE